MNKRYHGNVTEESRARRVIEKGGDLSCELQQEVPQVAECKKMWISTEFNKLMRRNYYGFEITPPFPSIRENFIVSDSDPNLTFCVPSNLVYFRIKNKHCPAINGNLS